MKVSKRKQLIEKIDLHFGDYFADEELELDGSIKLLFDMFQIIEKTDDELALINITNDELVHPVKVPSDLATLLRKKQVFLMMLKEFNDGWIILYMSPPYS